MESFIEGVDEGRSLHESAKGVPRVLLVGYNGANNTGSEARLLAIIDDIRGVLGPEALITVPTLNEANLRRYLKEGPHLRIAPIPSIFFLALRRLVREHDLIMLVEGSCYMDTWTSALLWFFLWATRYAHSMGKPCLAYAVDSGKLSTSNQKFVRQEASKTDLIIMRTKAAADRIRSLGVTAPIEVTADTAFTFDTDSADEGLLRRLWPEATSGVVGLCPVDFYLWPVVVRPWGRRENCYRWPYYYSRSRERRRATEALAWGLAAQADRIVEGHDKSVALICMEQLDEPIARQIQSFMKHADRARIFSSRNYNASQMTAILRGLDLIVTSRYHAGVLSLATQVPQVAVGHDLRLDDFYHDLGLRGEFFIDHRSKEMWKILNDRVERLLSNPTPIMGVLRRGYEEHVGKAKRNRELLRAFVESHGWSAVA